MSIIGTISQENEDYLKKSMNISMKGWTSQMEGWISQWKEQDEKNEQYIIEKW